MNSSQDQKQHFGQGTTLSAALPISQSSLSPSCDLDLHLSSLWFTSGIPPSFPPECIKRQIEYASGKSTIQTISSSRNKSYIFIGAMRDSLLRTYIVHLRWDASDPLGTVVAKQKQSAPPEPPSRDKLEQNRRRYSDRLAKWCETRKGTKVGNGECWTLAHEGLRSIGAIPSLAYTHGALILSLPSPRPSFITIARGDILQFDRAHFITAKSEVRAGDPRHTAIVVRDEGSGVVRTLEQNAGNIKKVVDGRYDLKTLVGGQVLVYRAMGEDWLGRLEAKW